MRHSHFTLVLVGTTLAALCAVALPAAPQTKTQRPAAKPTSSDKQRANLRQTDSPPQRPAGRPAVSDAAPGQVVQRWPLTKDNGPWMVLVKSFQGPEAIKYANELARELREDYRIDAYTLARRADPAQGVLQAGLVRGRVRQQDSAAVLAGNFATDDEARKLQDHIRKTIKRPKCITRDMVSAYQWREGVLWTAVAMINPLAPKPPQKPEELPPLLKKLNSGHYSLLKCPGDYTLQVLNFSGGVAYTYEQWQELKQKRLLEQAGEFAEQATEQLRREGVEAYVFHGLSSSIVCVGSFSSPDDPRIAQLSQELTGRRVGSFIIPGGVVREVPRK